MENTLISIRKGKEIIHFDPFTGIIANSKEEIDNYILKNNLYRTLDIPDPLNDDVQGFIFVLTTKCNLHCNYCYSITQNKPLSIGIQSPVEIIKKRLIKEKKYIVVNFFGGEPSLEMDTIKSTVEYLRTIKDKLIYLRISTNGTLSKDNLTFLIDNNFHIAVSSDGLPDESSNLSKRRVAVKVEETIKFLVKKNAIFSIRCTITTENLFTLPETVKYWKSLGVKLAHIEPYHPTGTDTNEMILLPSIKDYLTYFKKAIDVAEQNNLLVSTGAYMNLLTPSNYFCTGGSSRFKVFNPDGSISSCYRVQSYESPNKNFIIGNWKENTIKDDFNNLPALSEHTINNMETCNFCKYRFVCAGGCLNRNLNHGGSISKPDKWLCTVKQELIHDAIIRLWKTLKDGNKLIILGRFIFEDFVSRNPAFAKKREWLLNDNLYFPNNTERSLYDIYKEVGIERKSEHLAFSKKIARSECI
ncbi:MAG: SPASM domain-containing protein [Bacteroidetes bacterium]|nr:SPASM domain-containing protein [Bacteroidota bacterium]